MKNNIKITEELITKTDKEINKEIKEKILEIGPLGCLFFNFQNIEDERCIINLGSKKNEIISHFEHLRDELKLEIESLKIKEKKSYRCKIENRVNSLQTELNELFSNIDLEIKDFDFSEYAKRNYTQVSYHIYHFLKKEVIKKREEYVDPTVYARTTDTDLIETGNKIALELENLNSGITYSENLVEEKNKLINIDKIISRINNSFNWYRCHQELNNGLEGDQISIDMPLQPRNILKRMFNELNGNISGVIKIKPDEIVTSPLGYETESYNNYMHYKKYQNMGDWKIPIHSMVYATRNALYENRLMQTEQNQLFMSINSGFGAQINFYPSSQYVAKQLNGTTDLYSMPIENLSLYKMISFRAPSGIYLLSQEWCVFIEFMEVPIFGDSMRIAQMASEKKRSNEIEDEEIRKAEESKRRSDEIDKMWDDIWDDIYLERNK
jgi:hypothetical protein